MKKICPLSNMAVITMKGPIRLAVSFFFDRKNQNEQHLCFSSASRIGPFIVITAILDRGQIFFIEVEIV
jgi:hypothetical protein